ncbi:2-amino-3,7-dideoxy-D-threo-hept-6-ulosonate synthase [Nocardia iowensis]|uniref:2-amino-4,5-dihydroxy-6-one-heptanoic acid-7-phosphate synthase n=1 Tax=Nocardia iowensis TaxID=204891 RepID=A0ABX8RKF2_NOCIO|nr:2-amino-3,7-dideoxy-D-threo-hept-6-ulosonate synthase [Nocardia iowensis]QXN89387.1 2-amino-4,5-dihydroxy-6-one-heptanoic acid-7-phosphate synthase [Nocardia iowensis]
MRRYLSSARELRLRRLHRHHDQRLMIVPLDHSVTDGPVTGGNRVDGLVGKLSGAHVDAVVLHKGALRYVDPRWFTTISLIVHMSASTVHAPDPNAKYLVAQVEEALRLGADAVSVHVNLGSEQERQQVADLALVADACDRWNMPLMAMMYPRGPKISDPRDPGLIAHAVTLAADLGADIVKTMYTGDVQTMAEIASNSPVPLVVVGGPRQDDLAAVLAYVEQILRAGAAGVAMGRNIFQAADPAAAARAVADLVHQFGPDHASFDEFAASLG